MNKYIIPNYLIEGKVLSEKSKKSSEMCYRKFELVFYVPNNR